MEDLFNKWLAERVVELALVNTIAYIVERLPVINFYTGLHESDSQKFRCRPSLQIYLFLFGLTQLQLLLETLLIHDCLKEHLVLVFEGLLLLF